jgi:DNA-binding transcriptional regulator YiaG
MTKKYQSEQLKVCHQDAEALYQIGAISEAEMREFDEDCLVPEQKTPTKTHFEIQQDRVAAYKLPRKRRLQDG